jgi:uncharacterized membrane protein
MTAELDPPRPRVRWHQRTSALALLASICLNVALASYIAIQALPLSWRPSAHRPADELREPPDKLIATLASRLPNRDSDIIQEAYRAKKPELMAAIEVARNARIRVSSILAQRDLDMNELRAAFKQAMDSRTRMGELLADTVVDTLGRLSLDARRQLAKQIPSR